MFINLGSMDGFDTGKMLRYLCDISGEKGASFGRMDIKETYSFIDVEASLLDSVVQAFQGEVFRGRRIRADVDGGGRRPGGPSFSPKGGPRESYSGPRKTSDRGGYGEQRFGGSKPAGRRFDGERSSRPASAGGKVVRKRTSGEGGSSYKSKG
jgi:ATP-dependent RNA helicase DeaD